MKDVAVVAYCRTAIAHATLAGHHLRERREVGPPRAALRAVRAAPVNQLPLNDQLITFPE